MKFEVYLADGNVLEKVVEASNINTAMVLAYPEGCTKWRYLKKVKDTADEPEEEHDNL